MLWQTFQTVPSRYEVLCLICVMVGEWEVHGKPHVAKRRKHFSALIKWRKFHLHFDAKLGLFKQNFAKVLSFDYPNLKLLLNKKNLKKLQKNWKNTAVKMAKREVPR